MDADFFKYGEKISVFKNTRLCVDGQIRFKNATCGRRLSFKYGGKYLRFRKYPATCGRGLNVTLTNISSREANYFNNFMQYLKPISSPFLSLWYVLSMFLSFGHFSASLSYKKKFLIKKTHLVLGITSPSSTQHILVLWSPTSTTQALLWPQPNVEHTDS